MLRILLSIVRFSWGEGKFREETSGKDRQEELLGKYTGSEEMECMSCTIAMAQLITGSQVTCPCGYLSSWNAEGIYLWMTLISTHIKVARQG